VAYVDTATAMKRTAMKRCCPTQAIDEDPQVCRRHDSSGELRVDGHDQGDDDD